MCMHTHPVEVIWFLKLYTYFREMLFVIILAKYLAIVKYGRMKNSMYVCFHVNIYF